MGAAVTKEKLRAIAEQALAGVGDARRGEWHEWTGKAYHLRRRLSDDEDKSVGPAIDVRGTPEGCGRARAILVSRPSLRPLVQEELGMISVI